MASRGSSQARSSNQAPAKPVVFAVTSPAKRHLRDGESRLRNNHRVASTITSAKRRRRRVHVSPIHNANGQLPELSNCDRHPGRTLSMPHKCRGTRGRSWGRSRPLQVEGHEVSEAIVTRAWRRVHEDAAPTRTGLSREVAGWPGWRNARGRQHDVRCRVASLKVTRWRAIELPPARLVPFTAAVETRAVARWRSVPGSRRWVRKLVRVADRVQSHLWRALVARCRWVPAHCGRATAFESFARVVASMR